MRLLIRLIGLWLCVLATVNSSQILLADPYSTPVGNLNRKIEKLTGGFKKYTNKVNEIIDRIDWLNGMRTSNGYPIIEESRGPVIDSRTGAAQPQQQSNLTNQNFVNGLVTSSDINAGFEAITPADNPFYNVQQPLYEPITIPNASPSCYLVASDDGSGTSPALFMSVSTVSGSNISYSFTWTIQYEGVTFYSFGGSGSASNGNNALQSFSVGTSGGWLYSPRGLAGFQGDSGAWVLPCPLLNPTDTNPSVTQLFSYSFTGSGAIFYVFGFNYLPVIFLEP